MCNTIHARQIRQTEAAWTFAQGTITAKTEPTQPVETSKTRSVIFAANTFRPQAHKLTNSDACGIRYTRHQILIHTVFYCMVQGEKVAAMEEKSYNTIQYNTTLLSLCREICFLARHLHKNIQYS